MATVGVKALTDTRFERIR